MIYGGGNAPRRTTVVITQTPYPWPALIARLPDTDLAVLAGNSRAKHAGPGSLRRLTLLVTLEQCAGKVYLDPDHAAELAQAEQKARR